MFKLKRPNAPNLKCCWVCEKPEEQLHFVVDITVKADDGQDNTTHVCSACGANILMYLDMIEKGMLAVDILNKGEGEDK